MEKWLLAVFLKPLFVVGYFGLVAGLQAAVQVFMPDCWLKRQLLRNF